MDIVDKVKNKDKFLLSIHMLFHHYNVFEVSILAPLFLKYPKKKEKIFRIKK